MSQKGYDWYTVYQNAGKKVPKRNRKLRANKEKQRSTNSTASVSLTTAEILLPQNLNDKQRERPCRQVRCSHEETKFKTGRILPH